MLRQRDICVFVFVFPLIFIDMVPINTFGLLFCLPIRQYRKIVI
jgi:hypothetical protein